MNCNYKRTLKEKIARQVAETIVSENIEEFKARLWMKKNLTKRQQGIIEFMYLRSEGEEEYTRNVKELASWFRVSESTIYKDFNVLKEKKILVPNEKGEYDLTFDYVLERDDINGTDNIINSSK